MVSLRCGIIEFFFGEILLLWGCICGRKIMLICWDMVCDKWIFEIRNEFEFLDNRFF